MTRALRPATDCLNCGERVETRFCGQCGQENTEHRVSFGRVVRDLAEEVFQIESRLWRSLALLLVHPGRLTREYNAGRRVRYTTPLRLYLIASVSYFFIAAVLPIQRGEVHVDLGEPGEIDTLPPAQSAFARTLRERAKALEKLDPAERSRRARDAFVVNLPRVMVVLVPLLALLLQLFFRRRYYVEHLVLALHGHAFTFFALAVAGLTRVDAASGLALLASAVWGFVALHGVYGQSWLRTAWKAVLIGLLYTVLLSLGIVVAVVGGLLL